MEIFTISGSTYEVDKENLLARKVNHDTNTTNCFVPVGEWKKFLSLIVSDRAIFFWEDNISSMTETSLIVSTKNKDKEKV